MDGQNVHLDIVMVEYENLPSPQLNQQLLSQIDCSIKGLHWSVTFQCITMIRGICKSYPEHTSQIFIKYGMTLIDVFNNGTTQNIKNIIKLLREIFMKGQNVNIQTLVAAFLPLLIKKAANEISLIKQSCQQLMTVIASNCLYSRVIEVSTQLSCDKNAGISQIAIKLLSVIIMNIGPNLTQLTPEILQIIMKGMSILINGKRSNMRTSALDVCTFILGQIGTQNFLQLMNYSLCQQEIMAMRQGMQTHRSQKQKSQPVIELIKQDKQDKRWQQSGQRNSNIR